MKIIGSICMWIAMRMIKIILMHEVGTCIIYFLLNFDSIIRAERWEK